MDTFNRWPEVVAAMERMLDRSLERPHLPTPQELEDLFRAEMATTATLVTQLRQAARELRQYREDNL